MVGGRRTIYDGFAKDSRRVSPVGKRRLIQGPRDRLWTPDEQTYPPLNWEPVERPVCPSVSRQLAYRSDKPLDGAVKASTIAINVTSEPVGGAVPRGAVSVMRCTGKKCCLHIDKGRRGMSCIRTK